MDELSLFTGAGGGLLGTKLLGWRNVGYVEFSPHCQNIIKQRILDGHLDAAPIFGDVRKFVREGYAASYKGMADIVTAGFPCQPFSNLGRRKGEDDPQNMWPATIECVRQVRPRFALLENVPQLVSSGYFAEVLKDLSEAGYNAEWDIISAAETGADHIRERLWILAYSNRKGYRNLGLGETSCKRNQAKKIGSRNPYKLRLINGKVAPTEWKLPGQQASSRSLLVGKDDGLADQLDRLHALGNGQCPAVVARAWRLLIARARERCRKP